MYFFNDMLSLTCSISVQKCISCGVYDLFARYVLLHAQEIELHLSCTTSSDMIYMSIQGCQTWRKVTIFVFPHSTIFTP